jgi:hypothetical protein
MQFKIPQPKTLLVLILGAAVLYGFFLIFPSLQIGMDWEQTYRPAALAMAHGKSPYSVEIFYAAPWAVIPLIPFALLPPKLGNIGIFLLGLSAFAYVAYKLKADPRSMTIFLLSASVVGCLVYGNIEWMPLLGFVLPAPIGLIFAVIKPQVGIGLVVYWFVHILRTKGIWEVIKTFTPLGIVTLLSFWMYGFWPLLFQKTMEQSQTSALDYNTSLWPQGVFVGIWLLYKAIQKQKPGMALASSPFFSPYALQFTWVSVLAGLIGSPLELLLVSLGLWIPVVIRIMNHFS